MALSRTLISLVLQLLPLKAEVVKNCLLGWISLGGEEVTLCNGSLGLHPQCPFERNTQTRHLRRPACPEPLLRSPARSRKAGATGAGAEGFCGDKRTAPARSASPAMREGLSSACDAARPRLCRILRRIFGPKVASRVGPARYSTRELGEAPG